MSRIKYIKIHNEIMKVEIDQDDWKRVLSSKTITISIKELAKQEQEFHINRLRYITWK